LTSDVINAP